jgi:RNA polymerase sigma factor (sigma-70 family)
MFAEHGPMVLGLSRLLLRDPVEAEDAAQQVFLSAHQAVLRGSLPRDPPPWLAAITRNECRARVRARMREPLALPELPSDLPDPLAAAIRAADLQAVWAALAALPRRQRRALVLRELGGLTYYELGCALGVSHSAVESLLFRARQQVRALAAGANARLAALPVAWKVVGATVSVGVVATGTGDVHRVSVPRAALHPPHVAVTTKIPRAQHMQPSPVVAVREVPAVRARPRTRLREVERRRGHEPRAEEAIEATEGAKGPDPSEHGEGPTGEGSGSAPATEPTRVEASHEGPGDGAVVGEIPHDGHDGDDGHGGSSGSSDLEGGSDHSGPG